MMRVFAERYFRTKYLNAEAVAQMCSVKKVFLEISQNSQENTCVRVSILIKLQALGLQLYHKNFTPNNFFFTKPENLYTKLEIFYTKLMALLGFRSHEDFFPIQLFLKLIIFLIFFFISFIISLEMLIFGFGLLSIFINSSSDLFS